jgi:hypothetical protein
VRARLVVGSVTTSESLVLYVLFDLFDGVVTYHLHPFSDPRTPLLANEMVKLGITTEAPNAYDVRNTNQSDFKAQSILVEPDYQSIRISPSEIGKAPQDGGHNKTPHSDRVAMNCPRIINNNNFVFCMVHIQGVNSNHIGFCREIEWKQSRCENKW